MAVMQQFLSEVMSLDSRGIDAIDDLFKNHFPQQNLNDADYRVRKCHLLLQANLLLMQQLELPETTASETAELYASMMTSVAVYLAELEQNAGQAEEYLRQFISTAPLQTIANLITIQPGSDQAEHMRKLVLMTQLQPFSVGCEFDHTHPLYQQYISNWQSQTEQPQDEEPFQVASSSTAPMVAASSSEQVRFGIDASGVPFVLFNSQQVENRALIDAQQAITAQRELNRLAQAYAAKFASAGVSQDTSADTKSTLNDDFDAFECPIHFLVMDGVEATPYVYEDGYSYSDATFIKQELSSPLTCAELTLKPLVNQPLIEAHAEYQSLMNTWYELCKDYPNMPTTINELQQVLSEQPTPLASTSSTPPVQQVAASSSAVNSSSKKVVLPSQISQARLVKPAAGKGKRNHKAVTETYNVDEQVLHEYRKQLVLRDFIREKVRSGELNSHNREVQNVLQSCLFTIARTEKSHDINILQKDLQMQLSRAVMLSIPRQQIKQFLNFSAALDMVYSIEAETDPNSEYHRIRTQRRQIQQSYPLIRELVKLQPYLLQLMEKVKPKANLGLDAIEAKGQQLIAASSSSGGMNVDYDYLYKMIVVGDNGVGKSSLLLRFSNDTYTESYISTIGVDFKIKTIDVNGYKTKLQIWDTAGQERHRAINAAPSYRGTHAIVVCFDTTDKTSFENVKLWLKEVEFYCPENAAIILVGTKIDLAEKRQISYQDAVEFADNAGIPYVETSAKQGVGVDDAFIQAALQILNKRQPQQSRRQPPIVIPQSRPSSSGFFATAGEAFSNAAKSVTGLFKR